MTRRRKIGVGASSAKTRPSPKLVDRLRGKGDFKMTTDEVICLMRGPPPDDDAPRRS
jgi:hypothetical protein